MCINLNMVLVKVLPAFIWALLQKHGLCQLQISHLDIPWHHAREGGPCMHEYNMVAHLYSRDDFDKFCAPVYLKCVYSDDIKMGRWKLFPCPEGTYTDGTFHCVERNCPPIPDLTRKCVPYTETWELQRCSNQYYHCGHWIGVGPNWVPKECPYGQILHHDDHCVKGQCRPYVFFTWIDCSEYVDTLFIEDIKERPSFATYEDCQYYWRCVSKEVSLLYKCDDGLVFSNDYGDCVTNPAWPNGHYCPVGNKPHAIKIPRPPRNQDDI